MVHEEGDGLGGYVDFSPATRRVGERAFNTSFLNIKYYKRSLKKKKIMLNSRNRILSAEVAEHADVG